jgi:pimeloyl-ACP methyl ester carboxylesterase
MQLVSVTTSDYLRLHGCYLSSAAVPRVSAAKGLVDAAILVHGIGGNFYSSRLLWHFSRVLLDLGVSVVLINTRGHDMVNLSTWGGRARSVGAAFENVDHCRYDLAAWTNFLHTQGHERILWLGHSLGAIKALYAAAYDPHPAIQSIVALSPTRLSYQRMRNSPSGDKLMETLQLCQQSIAEGRGELPLEVHFPVTTWMTPNAYLDKYGPAEKYNWFKFVDQIQVPFRMFFGEKELQSHPAFEGLGDELQRYSWQQPETERGYEIVPSADHFYTACFEGLQDRVVRWLIHP